MEEGRYRPVEEEPLFGVTPGGEPSRATDGPGPTPVGAPVAVLVPVATVAGVGGGAAPRVVPLARRVPFRPGPAAPGSCGRVAGPQGGARVSEGLPPLGS